MKIVIAGCGWLGMHLAELLLEKGHSVTGTRRSSVAGSVVPLIVYHPDSAPDEDVKSVFRNADVVVLAFPPDRSSADKYSQDCITVSTFCGQQTIVIMISSTGVYPDVASEMKEEASVSTAHPISIAENALTELLGERLTIIRMAGLFGEDRLIVNHLSKSGKTYPAGEPVNLIHKDDAAGFCAFVIERSISGTVFNACAKHHPEKGRFYTWLADKIGISRPKFEASEGGKIINSDHSREVGYVYLKDDPYDFLD